MVPVAQLWWQWLGEDVCWQLGEELDGTAGLGASSPCGTCCLPGWQGALAGAHTGQLPLCLAETRLLILGFWGAAYAVHAPLAALLSFPCSVLDKACLSLRQTRKTRKGFYPQPPRRFVLIPEVPAPICRAAISQLSPPLFSVGREARHCCKLWPAE